MDFEKVCMMFAMQEPFYGILLSSMERVKEPRIPTMGVGRSGNVFKLFYNPDFVDSLPTDSVLEALKHETLHVAFNHFTLWDDHSQDEATKKKENVACDLEVNCYLDKSKLFNDKIKGLFPEEYGFERNLGAREYYKKLPEPQEQNQDGNDGNDGGDGSDGNSGLNGKIVIGKGVGDHSMWPKGLTDAEKAVIEQAIEDMVVEAAEIVEKSCGSLPGEMQIRLDGIRNRKKPRPAADWKRYVRRYLGNEFSELIRKSKKRQSRRFPDAPGNKHRRKSHILVAIDTSGSVGRKEYEEFIGQIKTLTTHATFRIVECDTQINREYDYTGRMPDTVFGGGGTLFEPPINLFLANRRRYDALLYFTDGYATVPDNVPKDTLWVISSDGNRNDKEQFRKNGASVVYIPKLEDNGS